MNSRERVLVALRHEEPDRVPVCLAYGTPRSIAERYGRTYDKAWMRQDVYMVGLREPLPNPAIAENYLHGIPQDAQITCWGVATWRSSTQDTYAVLSPLRNMRTVAELEVFPFPDVGADRHATCLAKEVEEFHKEGLAVQGAMSQTIFELAEKMYGSENLLKGFYLNPDFVNALLDEITLRKRSMALQFVRAGVDILRLGDDVGTQRGMMLSPAMWRAFLKPRLASIIVAARAERPGIPIFYHSDGDVREIIDDLIEIGITILNPIQPECMDPFDIKRRYGERLTLWGTVSVQKVFPFGTPEEIRALVRNYMSVLGRGGGYVIGPTHDILHDVPWENIAAFYDAVNLA
jgi:uroporphyrinogen decarboxylase